MLGNRTRVKVVKNKVAPPFKKAEFDIMYGMGISLSGDVLDCAVEHKIVSKAGSWFSYNGERIGQGRENVKAWLEENSEILEEIKRKVFDSLKEDDAEEDRAEPDMPIPEPPADLNFDEDGVIVE